MHFSGVYMPYLIYKWMRDAYNWDARISGVNAWNGTSPAFNSGKLKIEVNLLFWWLEDLLDP